MHRTEQGENTALETWVEEHYATAYRTACLITRQPADAEEAVQDAFLRAWRFRDALPAGDGHRAWLYRVLVNSCHSKLRAETLPDHLRTVVVLRYWTGLSEREIATAIRRRPGTVKSRLHEARRRLASDPSLNTRTEREATRP